MSRPGAAPDLGHNGGRVRDGPRRARDLIRQDSRGGDDHEDDREDVESSGRRGNLADARAARMNVTTTTTPHSPSWAASPRPRPERNPETCRTESTDHDRRRDDAPLRTSRRTSPRKAVRAAAAMTARYRRGRVDGKNQGEVRGIEEQDRVRGEQDRVQRDPRQQVDPGRSPTSISGWYGGIRKRAAGG